MRMIGHVQAEAGARAFGDYLYAQGIGNRLEPARDGTWELWVESEDQIATAAALLNEYQRNPGNPKYQQSARIAREKREQEQRENEAAQKRFFDSRKLSPGMLSGVGALTAGLIALSVVVGIFSRLGEDKKFLQPFFITEYSESGAYVEWQGGLPEIRHGQVWRLFTPMFIHFGPVHLIVNMLCLLNLGTMIERRQSWRHLAVLVLVISALSNFGQSLIGPPNFGGMSGVVYGLIGYIWLRGKFDPGSGLFLDGSTVTMSVIWFFLCLFHFIPNIANTVHAVGFGVGIVWGYLSALTANRHR